MEYTLFQSKMTEIKKIAKKKKPYFTRSDSNKKLRISKGGWRKPNGLHSKMRLAHRGFKKTVSIGYRNPAIIRGLEKSGMKKVLVMNLDDLKKIDVKNSIAVIGNIGLRKKIEIIKEAQKRKISLSNVKDLSKFLESADKSMAERKERKKKIEEKRAEAKKEKKEKKEEKKEEELNPEEKEKQERLEKEKMIIKRS